jgi:hypothetical protein
MSLNFRILYNSFYALHCIASSIYFLWPDDGLEKGPEHVVTLSKIPTVLFVFWLISIHSLLTHGEGFVSEVLATLNSLHICCPFQQ